MKKAVLFCLFFLSFLTSIIPLTASAHLPRYTIGQNISLHNPAEIDEPTISQVFYGQMRGTPDYYHFYLAQPTEIKISLLSPINETEFPQIELIAQSGQTQKLTGSFDKVYFEKFGADYYLKGPQEVFDLSSNNYLIKIHNASNTGRYALTIGQTRKFVLTEEISTFFLLPLIKQKFFGRPIGEMFLATLGFVLMGFAFAFSFGKHWKNSWRFGGASFLALTSSTLLLLIKNPFNILGFPKIILFAITTIATGIYLKKKDRASKILRAALLGLWLVFIFFTIASF